MFALDLIQEAVTAGGPAILHMPLLMRRLQVDLRSRCSRSLALTC